MFAGSRRRFFLLLVAVSFVGVLRLLPSSVLGQEATLKLTQRSREPSTKQPGKLDLISKVVAWSPKETAVIVCDMWDSHHCLNAVRRVEEMAPRMNQVLEKTRDLGMLIIHAPSSCMEPYKDHPARKRAQAAPKAASLPKDIGSWCYQIPAEEKGVYPIDQTDGGEDDDPEEHAKWAAELKAKGRNPRAPWKTQYHVLKIHDQDAISDSGVEIWNLMVDRGIKNVILVGVHTNMCVLGRPFGLRQMAKNGKNVVLMRDMTDTMYNPQRWPYVSHFQGTDLIVEHIEKFVCPTVTSDQLLGGRPFKFKGDVRKNIAVLISEPEYKTDETLPVFADDILEGQLGLRALVRVSNNNYIPKFAETVKHADAVLLSIRRRAIPTQDMEALKAHLAAGKPLLAIRTSSHAFDERGKGKSGLVEWPTFDPEVLGGNYKGHHGAGSGTTVYWPGAGSPPPLVSGIKLPFTSKASLYKTGPLAESATLVLMGSIPDAKPEPVAWTHTYKSAKIFYTSLGHKTDFDNPQFVRLMSNATRWSLGMRIPAADEGPKKK